MSSTNKIQKQIDLLHKVAEDITEPVRCFRLAAAVLHKKQIIGLGVNSYKTDPFVNRFKKNPEAIYLHAEVAAIKNALKRVSVDELKRCTLVVVRVKRNDRNTKYVPAMAKPCEGCQRCISEFGLKKVIYTTNRGSLEYL